MIPHLDIEAEYSFVRASCLIDIDNKDSLVMPAFLFFHNKRTMNNGKEYTSIDNPSYIFKEFKTFLEKFLTDKLTHSDKVEFAYVLETITMYQQAKELLDMVNWLDKKGVQKDI